MKSKDKKFNQVMVVTEKLSRSNFARSGSPDPGQNRGRQPQVARNPLGAFLDILKLHTGRGQSLVEIAITVPLLLLMFIGVMEVGWALRGYLVLVNANREAARFAARGRYLDFSQPYEEIGYEYVVSHTLDSIAGQLPIEFTPETSSTMIVLHYWIQTGKSCASPPCAANEDDCDDPGTRQPDNITDTTIIIPYASYVITDPTVVISANHWAHYGAGAALGHTSRLPDDLWEGLKEENMAFNCRLTLKDSEATPSINSVVAVELFYDQPQLLGLPVVSNRFTDPIPLYTHTIMRVSADARAR